ncbi:MAG: hypothetical protein ACXU87_23540, partial [Xanthobacteraceae bacterium]
MSAFLRSDAAEAPDESLILQCRSDDPFKNRCALICATTVAGIGIAACSRGGDNPAGAAPVSSVDTGRPALMASA